MAGVSLSWPAPGLSHFKTQWMSPDTATHSPDRYELVIFDMDGTLTEELLDFDAIRGEIGAPERRGILEHIAQLAPDKKKIAEAILHRHELAAAQQCVVHEGAAEVLAQLSSRGIRTALLTRNSSACATRILARHRLQLDYVATREQPPHKPHADSILNIARHFAILPEQTLMVGDYLYDLQAARNAGVDSALVCHKPGPLPEFATMATYVVRSLPELVALATGR
jgi:HAD superfamily hydrolase (TIGR01549 family)